MLLDQVSGTPDSQKRPLRLQGYFAISLVVVALGIVGWLSVPVLRSVVTDAAMLRQAIATDPYIVRQRLQEDTAGLEKQIATARDSLASQQRKLDAEIAAIEQATNQQILGLKEQIDGIEKKIAEFMNTLDGLRKSLVDPGPVPQQTWADMATTYGANPGIPNAVHAMVEYMQGGSYLTRLAKWGLKKRAFDAVNAKMKQCEDELRIALDRKEELARKRVTAMAKRVADMSRLKYDREALAESAMQSENALQQQVELLKGRIAGVQRQIDEAAVWGAVKHYVGTIWRNWIAPALHFGLIVALLLFSCRTSWRLALMRGWIGYGRV